MVGALSLADGSKFRVTQTWNGFAEPYSVRFENQQDDGSWESHYLDHEDSRWFSAKLIHNARDRTIEVYRGETLRGKYDLGTGDFDLP